MINVYLDWNVFNKIEKLQELTEPESNYYRLIFDKVLNREIQVPYSNAHLNDLKRGYQKNPKYTKGHLENISRVTNDLCIVQYWGNLNVTLHYRSVLDFFQESVDENEDMPETFVDLIQFIVESSQIQLNEIREELTEEQITIYQDSIDNVKVVFEEYYKIPLQEEFKELFSADPIFEKMFPKTKLLMTTQALLDDILGLQLNMKKDFTIYKELKKFINIAKEQLKFLPDLVPISSENGPKHLTLDETIELNLPKTKTSENQEYDKITNLYAKLNLNGFKADEIFDNMIDDSLHVFYGSHCDFFVTLDDRCHYKATEVYRQLGILTKVMKPDEFANYLIQKDLQI